MIHWNSAPMKTLRLTWWHLGLWLGLAVVACLGDECHRGGEH